jgi:hypothetical protein
MTSTFVYSKFSPPPGGALLSMEAVFHRAEQLGRQVGNLRASGRVSREEEAGAGGFGSLVK